MIQLGIIFEGRSNGFVIRDPNASVVIRESFPYIGNKAKWKLGALKRTMGIWSITVTRIGLRHSQ